MSDAKQEPPQKIVVRGSGAREREVTLPGRVGVPEQRLSNSELSQTRKLMWLTSAVAAAFALVGLVLFQLLIFALRGNASVNATGPRIDCIEGAEPDGCAGGLVCQNFRCVADDYAEPSRCQVGDACGTADACECAGQLQCLNNVCTAPEVSVDVCKQPAVLTALANLKAKCAGDIDVCPKTDLRKYAIDNPDFDQLMSEFPGTVTLHFPVGNPPLSKKDAAWPTKHVEAYYTARLMPALPALAKAQHVFIISRSSAEGDARRNDAFAQARSTLTKKLVLEALTSSGTSDVLARDAMRGKFADFLLGPQKQLDAALFRARYANQAITWSDASQRMLRALIERDKVTAEEEQWRRRVINQVVFIVPVPCALGPAEQGG